MKVAPRQANAFLASIPAAVRALLLHGNDLGLISERARKVATAFSDDLDDVFSVTHLEGDQLAGDAGALGDAAEAIAMTAPCRLVLVKGRGSEMLAACKLALARRLDFGLHHCRGDRHHNPSRAGEAVRNVGECRRARLLWR